MADGVGVGVGDGDGVAVALDEGLGVAVGLLVITTDAFGIFSFWPTFKVVEVRLL